MLTDLNLSGNNIGGETGYIKASEVEGESKEGGAKVIYQGREMVVSKGVDSAGAREWARQARLKRSAGGQACSNRLMQNLNDCTSTTRQSLVMSF